jgi:Abhydrolase family
MVQAIRFGLWALALSIVLPLTLVAEEAAPKQQCTAKTPAELKEWQAKSRTLLFKLLKLSDLEKKREESATAIPFNVKVLSTEDHKDYTLEEIEFDSTPTRRIKALITTPANAKDAAPAVVCIHGHGGNRRIVYDHSSLYRGFADELASHGYVTISTDVGQHEVYEKDRSLMGERLWDVLRCADYVSTLKNVDAERMGCAGLSLGGEMAMWLGGMDTRMKVTVSAGFLSSVDNLLNGHCQCWNFPGFTKNFGFCDIYSLIAPRPLLCQIGAKEKAPGGFPPSIAHEAMASIQRAYGVYTLGNFAQLEIHPEGHIFEIVEGCKFIDDNLKTPSRSGGG